MPDEWATGDLFKSTIASLRLRVALLSHGHGPSSPLAISKGEQPPECTDLLIACKPMFGNDANGDRGKRWLENICNLSTRGIPTIVDYTDHHLAANTPYKILYQEALTLCSAVITPSGEMKKAIEGHFEGDLWSIEDAVDTPVVPPKSNLVGSVPTLLWYGHASNIDFLIGYLGGQRKDLMGFRLLVLTDAIGASAFHQAASKMNTRIHCELFAWSTKNMLEAAKLSDWAIIPSDASHPSKRYVSTNRLMTAFSMGLPTAATTLPSYMPYAAYFKDIAKNTLRDDWTDLSQISALTKRAQREVLPRYSAQHLVTKWQSCVANYL